MEPLELKKALIKELQNWTSQPIIAADMEGLEMVVWTPGGSFNIDLLYWTSMAFPIPAKQILECTRFSENCTYADALKYNGNDVISAEMILPD